MVSAFLVPTTSTQSRIRVQTSLDNRGSFPLAETSHGPSSPVHFLIGPTATCQATTQQPSTVPGIRYNEHGEPPGYGPD